MGSMFDNCSSLTSLDMRYFNFLNVVLSNYMLYDCNALMEINVPGDVVRAIALPGTYVGTDGVIIDICRKENVR